MLMRGEWCELQQPVRFRGALVEGVTVGHPKKGLPLQGPASPGRGAGWSPRGGGGRGTGLWHVGNGVFGCQKDLFPSDTPGFFQASE